MSNPQDERAALPERDTMKPAEDQGLFRKFDVRRTDGSDQPGGKHHGCEYFVLDVKHDPHARAALEAYASSVANSHPHLAGDMRERYALSAQRAEAVPQDLLRAVRRAGFRVVLTGAGYELWPIASPTAAQPEAVPQDGQLPDDKTIAQAMLAVDDPLQWGRLGEGSKPMIKQFVAALLASAPPSPQPPAAQALEAEVAHWRIVAETKTAIANRLANDVEALRAQPPVAQALPKCHVAVIGSRFDGGRQHHVPQLLIEFDPVPAGSPYDAKGREDRDALADLLMGIGTVKPAQPEDENEVLRQKVKTLAREAWAWSKACEAESMKLTAVRKAIADAFLPMSRSGLWTKEHSQSYPSKAAEIINAARSIFDVEASQPAQPEGGITAPAGGGEGV